MGFFSLSKKQYNKQQAVGYVVYRSAGILFLGQQAMFVLKQSWSKAKKLLQLETILCLL